MQKIAIVSDIHGNLPALEKVAADIDARRVDRVFNLGDHISGPLFPQETLQFLKKQDWVHIRGNHDRQLAHQDPQQHGPSDRYAFGCLEQADLHWLGELPASLRIDDQFLLFHGAPSGDMTYLLETVENGRVRLARPEEILSRCGGETAPLLLCGHTHVGRVVELRTNVLVVNPGSVGLPAYDDVTPEYHVVETGSPHARYAVLEYRNGGWQVDLVAVAYDHQLAAHQARKNGRPDWEYALQTGFMPRPKTE